MINTDPEDLSDRERRLYEFINRAFLSWPYTNNHFPGESSALDDAEREAFKDVSWREYYKRRESLATCAFALRLNAQDTAHLLPGLLLTSLGSSEYADVSDDVEEILAHGRAKLDSVVDFLTGEQLAAIVSWITYRLDRVGSVLDRAPIKVCGERIDVLSKALVFWSQLLAAIKGAS